MDEREWAVPLREDEWEVVLKALHFMIAQAPIFPAELVKQGENPFSIYDYVRDELGEIKRGQGWLPKCYGEGHPAFADCDGAKKCPFKKACFKENKIKGYE